MAVNITSNGPERMCPLDTFFVQEGAITSPRQYGSKTLPVKKKEQKIMKKLIQSFNTTSQAVVVAFHINRRLRFMALVAPVVIFNLSNAWAQGVGFGSTDLKTGISNSLAVIMLFGFVLGIAAVIAGGFAIRRGDVDTGKLSIIGGAVIAAAPAIAYAFFKIFGLDSNSTVGVGNF